MCSLTEKDPVWGGDFACTQSGCRACQDALVRAQWDDPHHLAAGGARRRALRGAGASGAAGTVAGRVALRSATWGGIRFATYGGLAVERPLWAARRSAPRGGALPRGPLPAALSGQCSGHTLTRDVAHILNVLKCDPQTPKAPLPDDYGATVTKVMRDFEADVRKRQAEREHTLALTPVQQYGLAELRMAYADARDADNTRPQIAILEQAFRQPLNRASLQVD